MSSFHNAIGDTLSPLQGENSSQIDYGGFLGGFGQNGDYYDQHPDELPQSQRPPTEESQRPDASLPGGETQMLQYALGSHNSTAKGPTVGRSRSLVGLNGSQAALDALESQVPTFRRKSNFPKKRIASSPPDPNWKMPSNVLDLHETPQRTPSYPSLHSNSNYKPNYEQTSTKRSSGVFSQRSGSNGGMQELVHVLDPSNDAGLPISQTSTVAPVTTFLTGGLPASSSIFAVEPIGLHGTQTLVRATPSPPRPGPQPSSSTFPAPSAVGHTATPIAPNALAPILEAVPTAVLTRQETDVIPETPQSDQDLPQAHQRIPSINLPLTPPVIKDQESFVIPEPQAKAPHNPGPSSPRKRSVPSDFEEPPTPTKKTRRLSNGSRKSAGVKPVASQVGVTRGKQEATSPPKAHTPARKPPNRISSPSKAIMAPRTAMWDETLDDGFGRKAAETAAKTKKAAEPPVRSLSDFGESQLVPIAVIMPSGKTKLINPPSISSKKKTPKEVGEEAHPKKGKGRVVMKTATQAKAQPEESESMKVGRRRPSTRSTVAVKDIPSNQRAGKSKLGAAIEALPINQEGEAVETRKKRKATRSSKSKKDVPPDSAPAPTPSFRLETSTRKSQKRKLDEEEDDGPSSETPPKKKRKALHVETQDEAPPAKLSRKRKTSLNTDADASQPPLKKRRNTQVIVNEESSGNLTQTRANAIPLASLPHAQSSADTTTSLRSASQAPNRVFAKWAGNGMYYCGTLKKMGKREDGVRVCIVEYDDGEVAHVPLEGLRRCEVWVGDVLEVPAAKGKIRKSATVASVDDWEEHGRVRVSVAKGKGKSKAMLEEVDIESRDVSVLAARAEADVSWTKRGLSVEDLEGSVPADEANHENGDESYRDRAEETTQETPPTTKSRVKAAFNTRRTTLTAADPAPVSKSVARSTRRTLKVKKESYIAAAGSKVNREMSLPFASHAFLIALSLPDKSTQRASDSKDRERTKKRLQEGITDQGGVCIEDWDDLFQLQGTVHERRWIWEKSEDINYSRMQAGKVSTRKRSTFDRVWVLADEPNKNTKYFTALALGVPCVSSRWVEDGAKYPWSSYLLPAGHSSVLGQECAQIVNYDHAICPRTIKQLIDDPGSVRKPFAGKSLLFVTASEKRKKNFEADFEEEHALPIIACLMGPARVEIVHNVKHKSLDISNYDIIIWDTTPPVDFVKAHGRADVIITTEPWIKECLLTGALLEV